jgi:type IV pilus assembly protein PilB
VAVRIIDRIRSYKKPLSKPGQKSSGPGESHQDNLEETSIIQVVNSYICRAIEEGASDVHIEPEEEGLRIRLRIDGYLHDFGSPSKDTQPLIISRLKILAGMDISERRLPQDGRMDYPAGDGVVNIRVSTLPTIRGEKVVLRLLNRERIIMQVDQLGMSEANLAAFNGFIRSSHGMILVTGPTGCGKSTTLYSVLNHLNSSEKNIVTVEDPVEYPLKGVNQLQINSRIGLSFSSALRNILRQDPNIIMIGEIRDTETAEIATRAALTGHLVLSTLHTNDAPRAVTRLLDMGVKEYLLVSSLVGIIAQRLVRLLCLDCRDSYNPSAAEHRLLGKFLAPANLPAALYRARGCPRCNHTGFKGRMAIHEVLTFSEAMKGLVLRSVAVGEIEAQAARDGLVPLQQDGIEKALQGLTSISEVIRTTFAGI